MNSQILDLLNKGVRIPNPESVQIGEDVDVDRISAGATIYTGCKIFGSETLICDGAVLGYEGPATVENCWIGPQVYLKGGYFKYTVFLEKASMGLGAHVREGTLVEEQASGAHTVALKQTILFPFVTLGSLINFCDCLMAGGTSRKNHSEVGSSYIHFNYTPNQDKATASLIGDVPNGVFLDRPPIFLGGQGGLVGPCRLAFGTLTAAGSICRKDELRPGRLIVESGGRGGNLPFTPGVYRTVKRIVVNNVIYIANLHALYAWYVHVRRQFISENFPEALYRGAMSVLQTGIAERIKRLKELAEKMPTSIEMLENAAGEDVDSLLLKQKKELLENFDRVQGVFSELQDDAGEAGVRDKFCESVNKAIQLHGRTYIDVIRKLGEAEKQTGRDWLNGMVDATVEKVWRVLPLFR